MSSKPDPVSTFTASEIERAAPMPDRTIELLKREKTAPKQVTAGSRGAAARWDVAGLSGFVCSAVLSRVNQNPVQAARVAQGIVPALIRHYGHIPFGFKDLQRKVSEKANDLDRLRGPDGQLCEYRTFEAAWRLGLTDAKRPADNDYLTVIADDEIVGASNWRGLRYQVGKGRSDIISPLFKYRHMGKNAVDIETVDDEDADEYFANRFDNAETLVVLNLSKALRRTLVAIIEMRESLA